MTRAIETRGRVDQRGRLYLETRLPPSGAVRVIVLLDAEEEDFSERDWLRAAARSSAFEFLGDTEEDVYSLTDGEPFKASS